jgi:hypothetical protein
MVEVRGSRPTSSGEHQSAYGHAKRRYDRTIVVVPSAMAIMLSPAASSSRTRETALAESGAAAPAVVDGALRGGKA